MGAPITAFPISTETIDQFPVAGALTGTELVPIKQAGVTSQTTISAITAPALALIATLNSEVTSINTTLAANATSIATLNSEVSTINGQITTLNTEVAANTASIVTNTANIATIKGTLNILTPSGDTTGATDAAAIQAALTAMSAGFTAPGHTLIFESGEYYINAKMVLTFNSNSNIANDNVPFQIMGLGAVRIWQVTNNTGMFEFQVPTNGFPGYVSFEGIMLWYVNQQTSSQTNSVCLGVRSVNNTGTGTETSPLWNIDRVNCRYGFRAFANTQPAGIFSWWDVYITRCVATSMAGAAVWAVSPTTVGNPNWKIDSMLINQPYNGGSEAMISVSGCDNLVCSNVEMLQVQNVPCFSFNSVTSWAIIGCKGEACTYTYLTTGNNFVIETENSYGTIVDFNLNGAFITTTGGGTVPPILLHVGAGAAGQGVTVCNLSVGVSSGTGTLTCFQSNPAIRITVISPVNVLGLGSGPAVVRMTNSGAGVAESSVLGFPNNPGGRMPQADQGDTSFTLATPLTLTEVLIWNTPLTANRTCQLSASHGSVVADNLWDGAICRVIRTANSTGAFTLTITGTSIPTTLVVPIGGYAEFRYSYTLGWVEVDAGSL